MSTIDHIGNEGTVGEQAYEQIEDEVGFEVAERERNLRPSVEQEIRAKVDYADECERDGRLFGQTLEAQERLAAFEWEIERTRVRWDRRADSDREAQCRRTVEKLSERRRDDFAGRAGSVDRWQDPDEPDAREQLSQEMLGVVNRESARITERLGGWSRAAVSRLIAERVVEGVEQPKAVLDVFDELRIAPGYVIPIATLGEVPRREVSIAGTINQLWEPSHPAIQQVGLIEDESGRTKFTVWRKSAQPMVREGETVQLREVSKSWYQGRVSVAVTGRSQIWRRR